MLVWIPDGRAPKGLSTIPPADMLGDWSKYCGGIIVEVSKDIPELLTWCITEGYTFVAHNAAGFDALAYELLVGGPQPEWYDTLPCARAAALPGKLSKLGEIFFGHGKDSGENAMRLLTRARYVGGEVVYPVGTPYLWRDLIRYNIGDVVLLKEVYEQTKDFGEADVLAVDTTINKRGIPVDVGFNATLLRIYDQHIEASQDSFDDVTLGEVSNIRSVPQLQRWLEGKGFDIPSLNKVELANLFADPESYMIDDDAPAALATVVEALKLRQEVARTGKGKLVRILDMVDDDSRIRDCHVYYKSHTGRWAGRGIQPHNFQRGIKGLDVESLCRDSLTYDDIKAAAVSTKSTPADVIGTLVRSVIKGDFSIADYKSVEARGAAWIADEKPMLEIFRDRTQDIYVDMAKKVGSNRQLGKIIVLACGYGMGGPKFEITCANNGIKLPDGLTGKSCVEAYREGYPRIKAVWRECNNAAKSAILTGRPCVAGRCEFSYRNKHLYITLPSGRPILYRHARIEDRVPAYCALMNIPPHTVPTICFAHVHGYTGTLYGGMIVENIVQGICRDLLASALVRCEAAGLPVVVHVHDEIVVESDDIESLCEIMSAVPTWAAGFPVGVEGFTCPRYSKSPFSTSRLCEAFEGIVV